MPSAEVKDIESICMWECVRTVGRGEGCLALFVHEGFMANGLEQEIRPTDQAVHLILFF